MALSAVRRDRRPGRVAQALRPGRRAPRTDAVVGRGERPAEPAHPFAVTVGDEYQGACVSLGDAVLAATLVRLTLLPDVDVRCGIGYGAVMVHDAKERAVVQDGPGWWTAREAIDIVGRARDARRSWYVGDGSGTVNAFLLCRDQLIERLNDRGVRMLRLALLGRSQKQIAEVGGRLAFGGVPTVRARCRRRGGGSAADHDRGRVTRPQERRFMALALWLIAVGVCDLLRATRDATTPRRRAWSSRPVWSCWVRPVWRSDCPPRGGRRSGSPGGSA